MNYDCIIVGGGIAGLQAAVQLGRYRRSVLVIDAGDGRSILCRRYNNVLGWPDGVSGSTLRELGRRQAEELGVTFFRGKAAQAAMAEGAFRIFFEDGRAAEGKRLLLATGIVDRIPSIPGLIPTLGLSVYVCPDCDGYEVTGRKTVVMGAGSTGAEMAMTLTYWTDHLIYINHEEKPVDDEVMDRLHERGIMYIPGPIAAVEEEDGRLHTVRMKNGESIEADKGFVAFGGNEVRSELAAQLGARLHENRHILVDARTKMTSVPNVFAAGDIVAHSEQLSIAIGDGSQAAIWIHKSLLGTVDIPDPHILT